MRKGERDRQTEDRQRKRCSGKKREDTDRQAERQTDSQTDSRRKRDRGKKKEGTETERDPVDFKPFPFTSLGEKNRKMAKSCFVYFWHRNRKFPFQTAMARKPKSNYSLVQR